MIEVTCMCWMVGDKCPSPVSGSPKALRPVLDRSPKGSEGFAPEGPTSAHINFNINKFLLEFLALSGTL